MATSISEIHAVPPNELRDRGFMVSGGPSFIPYTQLTKGEMKLALLAEQARTYAAAFPENKEYSDAERMLNSALRAGVSNGVNFVGALYNPLLQQVAAEISKAAKQTAPASKGMLLGRTSVSQGVRGIGDDPIVLNFDHDCVQYATKATNAHFHWNKDWTFYEKSLDSLNSSPHHSYYQNQKALCSVRIDIEKIINSKITDASHHVLYYGLDESFGPIKNSLVVTKHLFHIGGIQGLANATDIDTDLMSTWSETAILRKNSTGGVGAVGSVPSSFYLSPDFDQYSAQYAAFQKVRSGSQIKGIGNPVVTAVIIPLIAAITAAVSAAAEMQKQLNAKKNGAMSAAQNYGTVALQAKQSDFNNPAGQGPTNISTGNNSLLLYGALAAGAYLLLKDD